jgi:hypothetical protein
MIKRLMTLILALAFYLVLPANAANIIWVSDGYDDNADGVSDDLPWVDLLTSQGYKVDYQIVDFGNGFWRTLDDAKIAALDRADLVIVSRNSNSGDYNNGDEGTQWNSVTSPLILLSTHIVRSSRWKWLNTGSTDNATPVMQAVDPNSPIFAGVTLDPNNQVEAMTGAASTFASITDAGNGTVIATRADNGEIWIATWEPGVEFYPGSGQIAGGPRMFFVAGTQEVTTATPPVGRGEMNLTDAGQTMFLNAVAMYTKGAPIITGVVRANGQSGTKDPIGAFDGNTTPLPTQPGGLMDGNLVFSDRTYPWSKTPAEMVGSEYIRTFNNDKSKSETDVTYTVTTASRALVWITADDRIPAEWDNGGTILSQQDAVDLAVSAFAAPGTFTNTGLHLYVHENATTDRPMSVYAAVLPAGTYVFGIQPSNKNFYTIGAMPVPAPEPSDVTMPGDAVQGVPNDGLTDGSGDFGWPAAEYPALAIDDNVNTKFLHFKGDIQPTGIRVTPGTTQSIVTGLTLTTANDTPGRDPVAYELSGSNESIDGPYTLIASGQITDFNEPNEWPRHAKNQTPITFDNVIAYNHYQLIFPAIRGPVGGSVNSMQIAEVELLGVFLNANKPSPANGEANVGINTTLSWSAGVGAVSHDVYFGTELPLSLAATVDGTSYNPGALQYGTTYYWRVDEIADDGTVKTGDIWSFTTTTPVGVFEYNKDIGGPAGIGRITLEGDVTRDGVLTQQYLMMGGGADIWGSSDQFHYAYNLVSGDIRVSAGFEWVVASNTWAKYGVMLRDPGADGGAINYANVSRRDEDLMSFQWRENQGGSSSNVSVDTPADVNKPSRVGIQRVTFGGLVWIQGLVDWGSGNGWESVGTPRLAFNLPDEIMAGVCLTSHDNSYLSQARVYDVNYVQSPQLVGGLGVPVVPAGAALAAPPSNVSGFKIHTLKPLVTDGWGYDAAKTIFDTGLYKGLPAQPGTEGTRVDQFINLFDNGNRGAFSEANGFPDASYPGIDPLEIPAQDPAGGDVDENFGTDVTGVIQLTAGVHIIGANSDDGTIIEIGGVEVGRTGEFKGASNVDFVYQVEADGYYPLRAINIQGGGGAEFELHEVLLDDTRILLNDVADGGSAVFAPAP